VSSEGACSSHGSLCSTDSKGGATVFKIGGGGGDGVPSEHFFDTPLSVKVWRWVKNIIIKKMLGVTDSK